MQTSGSNQPSPRVLPLFTSTSGPTPWTRNEIRPLGVFHLMVTVALLESIVKQTLLYAASKGSDFPEFCLEELQAFIGINIAMGLLKLPQVKDHWCTSEVLSTPWFGSIMARDRFFKIMRYLHLTDSSLQKKVGEPGYDPLYKIQPLIDHLSAMFPTCYQPSREVSIDEMMIGTRYHMSFLQYLPKKPCNFGVKVWLLAEAKTGYVVSFQIYTGATSSEENVSKDLAYQVVMDLMEPYQGKGHRLFIDNFYTSPALVYDLLQKGTFSAGTVRTNRKQFPSELKVDKKAKQNVLDVGHYHFATYEDLTLVLWHDRRDVYLLSSMHSMSVETVLKRPKGGKEKVPIPCPTSIYDYNQFMGGVDLADQQLSYYSLTQRKTIKWGKMVEKSVLAPNRYFNCEFVDNISSQQSKEQNSISS